MATKKPKAARPSTRETDPWHGKSVAELAAEQGAEPVTDFDAFLQDRSDVGPDDEGPGEFLHWLREVRRMPSPENAER